MYMVTVGLSAHWKTFATMQWNIFFYFVFIYLASVIIYLLLLKVFHLPWEMGLLAHMACVGGPIAAPPLAKSYDWTDLVLPSIIIAILGQVFGSYIGVGTGMVVRAILGG